MASTTSAGSAPSAEEAFPAGNASSRGDVSAAASQASEGRTGGGRRFGRIVSARSDPSARPAYVRPVLWAILAVAAVLFAWDIQHSVFHTFYAETARSMAESWHGFLFGAFDPGASITIDKLPGFLWPQALSARIFGFHPWALTLPQVIEGVLSVAVLYRAVRRWAGESAALLAAGAFALTPAVAGLFRTAVEDPAFTLCVLLAADATLRAARGARLRPLLAAGAWVGLGFQAKMLESWAVLPALGLLYVLAAPTGLRRRLAHLSAAGAMCLAVSASWVLLVTFTPAQDRPYIDGTTDNSAVSQVVGYNFLNRFSDLHIAAKDTGSVAVSTMAGTSAAPPTGHSRPGLAQWAKMFAPSLVSQIGWLYPAAALAAVCGVVWRRGRPRTDPLRAGFVLWGVWLVTYFLVFSGGAIGGHTYYMGVVAIPLAALFGGGTVQFWRAWLRGRRARSWALPTVVGGTVVWSAAIAALFPDYLPWLAPAAVALGAGALVLLAGARRGFRARREGAARSIRTDASPARRRTAVLGLATALVAMLLPSAAWASSVLDPTYGHSGMGSTGPVAIRRHSAPHGDASHPAASLPEPARRTTAPHPADDTSLTPAQRRLLAYTRAHRDGAAYLFATTSWRTASPYILYTGAAVLPMGGFTGTAPTPTMSGFRHLVATGQLRYVVLGGPGTGPGRAVASWARAHCDRVPGQAHRLYRCTPKSAAGH
ncbi:glycosyltransferase family 39 protein (plasmid) [Streptomyces sp. BHT-5-2]|uniref:ArnT family glycosyltransferase n=1 Tax=Streptomyces sp. BHT-5-2 TaxID=2866715 RepID=UPI001C8D2CE9|nr:glycosyltransferase family 39 protein [Streptomyces sp. BHT-5-2]QZL07683.1 glycosyltransferase family 39 protein [Streptomyces sp. BHT-5-2]